MPKLFSDIHGVLKDLESMSQTSESAPDGLEVDQQLLNEVEQLSNITDSELACRFCYDPRTTFLLYSLLPC